MKKITITMTLPELEKYLKGQNLDADLYYKVRLLKLSNISGKYSSKGAEKVDLEFSEKGN